MLKSLSFGYLMLGQGNDDVKCDASSSHVGSIEELEALSAVLTHDGEFGERMRSIVQYESVPKAVAAFTAEELASKRGRVELVLRFLPVVEGENGKKEYITIEDTLYNDALFDLVISDIKALPAGAWPGINKQVETVNIEFTPRRGN